MKFLLFSDPHISSKAEFSKPTNDGFTDYLHRVLLSFSWVCDQVTEHKPDFVAMLGDLFDTTGFVDTISLHVGSRVCKELSSVCEDNGAALYWLIGNHDIYSKQSHNLKFLGLTSYGKVIERLTTVLDHEFPITFLPWGSELNQDMKRPQILLSHAEIRGGILNEKAKSKEGLDPDSETLIFNGHYHLPDRVKNCYQVGSLLSRDFRDGYSDSRGAVLVECSNVNNLTTSGSAASVLRLKNPHEIPYRTVEILSLEEAVNWSSKVESGVSGLEECYVRVVCDELFKDEAEKISYLSRRAKIDFRASSTPAVREDLVSETFSPEENFRQYVKDTMLFDEDSDIDMVLSRGLSYIESVRKEIKTSTQPIEFKKLHIVGFQSIGNVEVNLHNQGLVWVGGANGVGKTTLLESLLWAITGKSARHGDRPGDDVIGWDADECKVTVDLSVGGKEYTVVRGRDPNILNMYLDGNDVSARRIRDTDKRLIDLIGRSKDVLQHSIFLTSGLETRFTALSYPDRVRLLESITDAGIYSEIEKLAKHDVKRVLHEMSYQLGVSATISERLKSLISKLPQVMGALVEAKKEHNKKRDKLKSDLQDLIDQRGQFESLVSEKKTKRRKLEDQEALVRKSLVMISAGMSKLQNKLVEMNTTAKHIAMDISKKQKLIKDGKCPTCLSTDVGRTLKSYVADKRKLFEEIKVGMSKLSSKFELYKKEKDTKEQMIESMYSEISAIIAEEEWVVSKISAVDRAISAIKIEINVSSSNVDKLEAKKEELQQSIDEENVAIKESELASKRLEADERIHSYLLKAFSTNGIRASMLSTVTVPFLNKKISLYSDILGMPFELVTRTEDNKIDIILPGKRTYKSCSRGERRRIDLAMQCAINDLAIATGGSKVNLLVADEVIDPLDDDGVKAFLEVLQKKAEDSTVVLITHKPFIDSYAAKRWLLVKEYDVTSLQVT